MAHPLLDDALSILTDLIAFPTVSLDSNLALVAYVNQRLDLLGARTHLSLDPSGSKANLFATLGPADTDGGVVLSGHTDVVPVEGQDWSSDPFTATQRGDRIYGRGTCDMKGFLACALAFAPQLAPSDRRPVHLALTYDEEVGCLGAQEMLRVLAETGPRPALCIVGEPTGMRIVEGHKGCCEYSTTFSGLEGHGSQPELGVNAVEYAVRYITRLLEIGEALKSRAPAGSPFEPPWSTIQVGRIAGGVARNIIAGSCSVDWELRPVNSADFIFAKESIRDFVETELLPRMSAVSSTADIVTAVVGEVRGLEPISPNAAEALVRSLTGDPLPASCVSFGTEAGLFQQHGIATVICGPGFISEAHKPDEFIAVDQLDACLGMIGRLVN